VRIEFKKAESKFNQLDDLNFEKHLIGSLQSNKETKAIEYFDVIQSIESISQLRRLTTKVIKLNLKRKFFIQVNTSGETSKHGLSHEEEIWDLIEYIQDYSIMEFAGLMTIGAYTNNEKIVCNSFKRLYELQEKIYKQYKKYNLIELSMGMSTDFEWAIQEGATIIRLGRILFDNKE